jgi:hypothetical protein
VVAAVRQRLLLPLVLSWQLLLQLLPLAVLPPLVLLLQLLLPLLVLF